MQLKRHEDFLIKEGTSNYWPGYSDYDTADTIAFFIKKNNLNDIDKEEKILKSSIINKEIKLLEKELLSMEVSLDYTKDKRDFWQSNLWSNITLTYLQEGFLIQEKHINKVLKYIQSNINNINCEEYLSSSYIEFKNSMLTIINHLKKLKPNKEKFYYEPNFFSLNLDKFKKIRSNIESKTKLILNK